MLDMELPEELMIQILVKLPVKSLFRFKSVCKHWRSVIQSPQFRDDHRLLSETRKSSKLLCYRKDPISETYVVSVHDNHTLEKQEDLQWPPFFEEEDVEENGLRRIKIFGPVNGIYCIFRSLVDKWAGTLTLWNPATRDYKRIRPQISFPFPMHSSGFKDYSLMQYHEQQPKSLNIGFGFDQATNDYKVVVICQWEDEDTGFDRRWHLRVYNHASYTWRTVYYLNCRANPHPLFAGASPPFPLMERDPPISHCLLNGVFHWACTLKYENKNGNCYTVLAFDMTRDVFRLMKGPPLPTHLRLYWSVWVLKDTIAAVSCTDQTDVEVWLMTEYGDENSWDLLYRYRGVNPVGIPNNDRIFFDDLEGRLVSVGVDKHRVQKHGVYGMTDSTNEGNRGTLGILDYVETFATLKAV